MSQTPLKFWNRNKQYVMSGEAGDEPRAAAPGVGDVEDDNDAAAADTSVGADADAAPGRDLDA